MPKLTVRGIEERIRKKQAGRYADGQGLHLHVRDTGSWAWVLRVQVAGQRRDIGLGSLMTLAEARDEAARLRRIAKGGADPVAERDKDKAKPNAQTFAQAAEACHASNEAGWSDKHADAWLSSLTTHAFPELGKRPVASIDATMIETALKPVWQAKPAMARKVRHRIFETLNYAHGKGWRSDPAPSDAVRTLLKSKSQPRAGNFPAMPFADVPAYVAGLLSKPLTMGRLGLLLAIATAARSGEVRKTLVSHVDPGAALWNRPAEIMKNGLAHSVTLNAFALWLIEQAAAMRGHSRPEGYLMPGKGGAPMSDMTISKILREAALPYVPHGFRSSFRDWAAEEMPHIPDPVAEAALAHVVSDETVKAYKRANFVNLRRELLDAWGVFVTSAASANGLHCFGAAAIDRELEA